MGRFSTHTAIGEPQKFMRGVPIAHTARAHLDLRAIAGPKHFLSFFFDNGPNWIELFRMFQGSTPANDKSCEGAPVAAQPRPNQETRRA